MGPDAALRTVGLFNLGSGLAAPFDSRRRASAGYEPAAWTPPQEQGGTPRVESRM